MNSDPARSRVDEIVGQTQKRLEALLEHHVELQRVLRQERFSGLERRGGGGASPVLAPGLIENALWRALIFERLAKQVGHGDFDA